MISKPVRRCALDAIDIELDPGAAPWLWQGYLHPGDLTLLTSFWKSGKTTLVCGLLRQLADGGEFLGLPVRRGRALVVSEESEALWAARMRLHPVGGHVDLMARPFGARPTPEQWADLIDLAAAEARVGRLDLFVVDPLASFLPGHSESSAATLIEMLQPLHRLCAEGCAVLLLHHPRKQASEAGHSARGSGALQGFIDISVELSRYSRLGTDSSRRLLFAQSRRPGPGTPERLAYEWNRTTNVFTPIEDVPTKQFLEQWEYIRLQLERHPSGITHIELLKIWPEDRPKPSVSVLYEWLHRAHGNKLIRRFGSGVKGNAYHWRLENEDDKYRDRGELPPIRPLFLR